MAETKRMTAEQVVGYLLEGEGLDFLRESLAWVVQQLMEELSVEDDAWLAEVAKIDPREYRIGSRTSQKTTSGSHSSSADATVAGGPAASSAR
jgi:hypothetical protein